MEYPSFQITFPHHETSSIRTYRKTNIPNNLQIPIREVFHAFLNKVKEFNQHSKTQNLFQMHLKNLNNIY